MSEEAKQKLLTLMVSIAEASYHAGWMEGSHEHKLWHAVLNGTAHYGQTYIDEDTIKKLDTLSKQAGGWWIYDTVVHEKRFLLLNEWERYYSPEIADFRLAEVFDDIRGTKFAKNNVYFIYDGECPICTHAAYALRIKKKLGRLILVNARKQQDHPLLGLIKAKNLDLDDGMVIFTRQQLFHGKSALQFMARYGAPKNTFNIFCKSLFWSNTVSALIYPWMRGTRNLLLRRKEVGRIDNLNLKAEPIFKSVFGAAWNDLPPVIKKHYANRPYTDGKVTVEGVLHVTCAGPIKAFAPFFWLMGGIPPHNEKDVPVTVHFESAPDTKAFHFNRIFHFKTRKPYAFRSRMIQIAGNDIVEIMRFGIGWRMRYLWQGGKVILQHNGYMLHLFGHLIPLPLTPLMGKGYAEEIPVDDEIFDMFVHITHPFWGKVYEYRGRFRIIEQT